MGNLERTAKARPLIHSLRLRLQFESHSKDCWACSDGSPPQTEAGGRGVGLKKNDNNYLFLRRFFFSGARFEADSAPSRRRALFVARVGEAASGSSGHGCFGYLPRGSARTEG